MTSFHQRNQNKTSVATSIPGVLRKDVSFASFIFLFFRVVQKAVRPGRNSKATELGLPDTKWGKAAYLPGMPTSGCYLSQKHAFLDPETLRLICCSCLYYSNVHNLGIHSGKTYLCFSCWSQTLGDYTRCFKAS